MDYTKYITSNSSPNLGFTAKGDCTKLKNLGWKPKYDFNKTLNTILTSYKNKISYD